MTDTEDTRTVEIFEDEAGEWRWRLRARNGQVQATSGEAFDSQWNAKRAAFVVFPALRVEIVPQDQ
jgi:uncharacterized protein YegP (UPF0339 family)